MTEFRFDAFLSYSQKDSVAASKLHHALQSVAKPWWKRRTLRVFLDTSNLASGPSLPGAIEDALATSRFLVVILSPNSEASPWVMKELAWWLEHRGPDSLVLCQLDCDLRWDSATNSLVSEATPEITQAISKALTAEPLWHRLSPRDKAQLQVQAVKIAARILGRDPDEFAGRDLAVRRRNYFMAATASGLILLLGAFLKVANDKRAAEAAARAEAQQRALNASIETSSTEPSQIQTMVRKLSESWAEHQDADNAVALRYWSGRLPGYSSAWKSSDFAFRLGGKTYIATQGTPPVPVRGSIAPVVAVRSGPSSVVFLDRKGRGSEYSIPTMAKLRELDYGIEPLELQFWTGGNGVFFATGNVHAGYAGGEHPRLWVGDHEIKMEGWVKQPAANRDCTLVGLSDDVLGWHPNPPLFVSLAVWSGQAATKMTTKRADLSEVESACKPAPNFLFASGARELTPPVVAEQQLWTTGKNSTSPPSEYVSFPGFVELDRSAPTDLAFIRSTYAQFPADADMSCPSDDSEEWPEMVYRRKDGPPAWICIGSAGTNGVYIVLCSAGRDLRSPKCTGEGVVEVDMSASPDGRFVAFPNSDYLGGKPLLVADLHKQEWLKMGPLTGSAWVTGFDPSSRFLGASFEDGRSIVWDLQTMAPTSVPTIDLLAHPKDSIKDGACLLLTDTILVSCTESGGLVAHDWPTGRRIWYRASHPDQMALNSSRDALAYVEGTRFQIVRLSDGAPLSSMIDLRTLLPRKNQYDPDALLDISKVVLSAKPGNSFSVSLDDRLVTRKPPLTDLELRRFVEDLPCRVTISEYNVSRCFHPTAQR